MGAPGRVSETVPKMSFWDFDFRNEFLTHGERNVGWTQAFRAWVPTKEGFLTKGCSAGTQAFDDTGRLVGLGYRIRSGGRFVKRTILKLEFL